MHACGGGQRPTLPPAAPAAPTWVGCMPPDRLPPLMPLCCWLGSTSDWRWLLFCWPWPGMIRRLSSGLQGMCGGAWVMGSGVRPLGQPAVLCCVQRSMPDPMGLHTAHSQHTAGTQVRRPLPSAAATRRAAAAKAAEAGVHLAGRLALLGGVRGLVQRCCVRQARHSGVRGCGEDWGCGTREQAACRRGLASQRNRRHKWEGSLLVGERECSAGTGLGHHLISAAGGGAPSTTRATCMLPDRSFVRAPHCLRRLHQLQSSV